MFLQFLQAPFLAAFLSAVLLFGLSVSTEAGCGCDKPPPPLATVRPYVTYAGSDVTLFHPALQPGRTYTVTFTSGITGENRVVASAAVWRRDLTDGQYKPQLQVRLPDLPLGPTNISVSATGQAGAVLFIPDDAFTVAPRPLLIPAKTGRYHSDHFEAAISRAGVVYFSLDMSEVTDPMVFRVRASGYPLRFRDEDVMFYNRQGYLMQLLNEGIPGLSTLDPADKTTESDVLQYSRHEFNSFYLQHKERQVHALDPTDPNWHLDGTPHVDHNYLIVAVTGHLPGNGGGKGKGERATGAPTIPLPGASPEFKLKFDTFTLFRQSLFGDAALEVNDRAEVEGDVVSNGVLLLSGRAKIRGDATAFAFDIQEKARVEKGREILATELTEILPIVVPPALPTLAALTIGSGQSEVLRGPGSYRISDLTINGGRLVIDNKAGPVTVYVTGRVDVSGANAITVVDKDVEGFALYVVGDGPVGFTEQEAFHGVVYAPRAPVRLAGQGKFYGSFVGQRVKVEGDAQVYYAKSFGGK
jgi:hypothetical protein